MITPSTIYWLTRLDHIEGEAFLFAGILMLMAALVASIAYADIKNIILKRVRNITFAIGCATLPVGIATEVFLPTTKEAAAMLVIPKIANSESVQQLGDGIVDLANQWLKELAPKKDAQQ